MSEQQELYNRLLEILEPAKGEIEKQFLSMLGADIDLIKPLMERYIEIHKLIQEIEKMECDREKK